jgi:hypothetical protein
VPGVAVHSLAALELAVVSAVVGIVVVALVVARTLVLVRHILALEPAAVVLGSRLEQVAPRIADLAFHIHQEPELLPAVRFPASL